ncbi:MAG: hypothetical protein MZV70_16785 [Desulfobacterales bacterium]|nr:hypothetical protein [Desulfobacterales bacterium]
MGLLIREHPSDRAQRRLGTAGRKDILELSADDVSGGDSGGEIGGTFVTRGTARLADPRHCVRNGMQRARFFSSLLLRAWMA